MKWHTKKVNKWSKEEKQHICTVKTNIRKTQDIKKLNNQSRGMNIVLFQEDSLLIISFPRKQMAWPWLIQNLWLTNKEQKVVGILY